MAGAPLCRTPSDYVGCCCCISSSSSNRPSSTELLLFESAKHRAIRTRRCRACWRCGGLAERESTWHLMKHLTPPKPCLPEIPIDFEVGSDKLLCLSATMTSQLSCCVACLWRRPLDDATTAEVRRSTAGPFLCPIPVDPEFPCRSTPWTLWLNRCESTRLPY